MCSKTRVSISGTVTDVFAHRVVLENDAQRCLVDLGPASLEMITLTKGMRIKLTGEMKPSELKAETVSIGDGPALPLRARKGDNAFNEKVDPDAALSSAEARGFIVIGQPRQKPKHFELLAKDVDGALHELHIEFDGTMRKIKPAVRSSPKWSEELELNKA